ncbi:MAG: hypothetical protein M1839_004354 [Geoglossum umbratile]|nr:MAG: hypothetical protein M1839_004354 [Geoglossum umbratile]
MDLRKELRDSEVTTLRSWLKNLAEKIAVKVTNKDAVMHCYELRGERLEMLRMRSKQAGDCFGELAHYIGRLGAHQSVVLAAVDAMLEVPSLQNITGIRAAPASMIRKVNVSQKSRDYYNIVSKICAKDFKLFFNLDLGGGLKPRIREKMEEESSITTRVHSELILVDYFARNKYAFVGDDMYVGCSKPACYFCFNWIKLHHKGYVQPATHNKIILGCHGPDSDLNGSGESYLRSMYQKMTQTLERDLFDFLFENQGITNRFQHMSTEGSSRPLSVIRAQSSVCRD